MEIFAEVIGALDEHSILVNSLDFIQTWTKLSLSSYKHVRARSNVTSFFLSFFLQIKIASSFSGINLGFVVSVLNNKTIILLNLAEYRLILANSAYGLIG